MWFWFFFTDIYHLLFLFLFKIRDTIAIAIYKSNDVRPILKAYEGKNIPIEYAKKEAEAKQKFLEEWRQSGKSKTTAGPGFTLSGLFGGSSVRLHDISSRPSIHPSILFLRSIYP